MTNQIVDTTYLLPEIIKNPFEDSKATEYLFTGRSFSYIPPNIEHTQKFWENLKTAKELIIAVQKIVPISVNFLQRSKDYFSALNWSQYVLYSYTDRLLSLSIDPDFLTDWPDFTDCTLNQTINDFQQFIASHNGAPRIDLAYLFITMANAGNEILRAGNCGIMANVTAIMGNSLCRIEKISIENGDHAACVIGRDPHSSRTDYTTWGENAVICDPWSSACFAATEVPSHLFNYKKVSQDRRHPVVERYDSSTHLLIVSSIQPTEISTINRQLALLSGQPYSMELLLNFISTDNLQRIFLSSTHSGQCDIIYSIINSERFKDISLDCIEEAFRWASHEGDIAIFNAFINSERFKDISLDCIEKTFLSAVYSENITTLDALINLAQFKEISLDYIEKAFLFAGIQGNLTLFNVLINLTQFKEISLDCIEQVFQFAAAKENITMLHALINSERFKEISLDCVERAFESAAYRRTITTISALINSERFKEISLNYIENAFRSTACDGEITILNALINSERFNEISLDCIELALKFATIEGKITAVDTLKNSTRFKELSS